MRARRQWLPATRGTQSHVSRSRPQLDPIELFSLDGDDALSVRGIQDERRVQAEPTAAPERAARFRPGQHQPPRHSGRRQSSHQATVRDRKVAAAHTGRATLCIRDAPGDRVNAIRESGGVH